MINFKTQINPFEGMSDVIEIRLVAAGILNADGVFTQSDGDFMLDLMASEAAGPTLRLAPDQ